MATVRYVVVAWLVACKQDAPPPAPPAPPPAAPAAPAVPATPIDPGSCTLHATGAFTGDETTPGGHAAVASKYWNPDDNVALTINCIGKDLRVSAVPRPDVTVPFGPKLFARGELIVLARAGKALTEVTGTIEVTAFDDHHVAGTIAVTGKRPAVTITGSFDLARVR